MAPQGLKDYSVRLAREGDLAEVDEMASAYFKELDLDLDPEGLDVDIADPGRVYQGGGILVVVHQGLPVGMVGLRLMGAGQGEIKRMYIRPGHRGSGLGRRMLEAVIGLAREKGFSRLVLDTRLDLEAANALYESFGFRDIEDYNQNPRAQRFMELDLKA